MYKISPYGDTVTKSQSNFKNILKYLKVQKITFIFACICLFNAGCKSFSDSVKPLLNPTKPEGYEEPKYVRKAKNISEVIPSSLTLEVWRIDTKSYPDSIKLYVRVFDAEGNLVSGLAPPYYNGNDDYKKIWNSLQEQIGNNGTPQEIKDFSVLEVSEKEGLPYYISMALDYSGSMGQNITPLEDAALNFVKMKGEQDKIAVVKFDDKAKLVSPLTHSISEIQKNFEPRGLNSYGGYTALYQGAKLAEEQIITAPKGNSKALVLFTDGEDNASIISANDLYKFSTENSIPVFTVAFGIVNKDVLSQISKNSGGRFYQTYSANEFSGVFQDIYHSLRNYYVITYKPPKGVGKHFVSIGITPPGTNTQKNAKGEYNTLQRDDVVESGSKITVENIYFDYNKAEIKPESNQAISGVYELMKEYPRLKFEIRGHTDSDGTEEYNQKLSELRAEAVRRALVELGISADRLRFRGFGMMQPVAPNNTEEGKQKNRRTEFVILAK